MMDLLVQLLPGLYVTLRIFVVAALVAMLASLLGGLARLSQHKVICWLAQSYVVIFRGTSALVQLFWVYFGLPLLGVDVGAFTAGVLVLGLNTGAYGTEIVRGAVEAVPKPQWETAQVLGFSRQKTLWRIVLPQALVSMLPPFGNLLIELLKGTALVSLITLSDLTFQARLLRDHTLRTAEIFGLVLVLYFGIALLLTFCMRWLEQKVSVFRGEHGRQRL